ncbi:MFS transporter [Paracoccus sp. 1_MG-2023]|uniref:MFS transporter n=1 Tax=unclassified Paracoccus (in: a-proteobacteria) TaxID=2688777 RepID=UPI001C083AC5|nr:MULTISPECIES: MFS transporter [unclassified Paracoccus (in: a-proteobacteria)]MBU2956325.1 MFS transporter [Paracoccus sp. C2R09]MDO6668001.1 MFS transporter [Paracoccus sp. 1_MG-2023]
MTSTDAQPTEHATIDEVVTTVIMARVTDFFGFFVYAIASALVFPELFFPNYDPVTGTLLSFAVFSLAFIARPIASMLGREVQKIIGRRGKVVLALMILGVSTVAIGLLPGHASIGAMAPILLAVLRFVQGIGLGGAWDGLTLQLQNAAPEGRKGVYGMVPQLGGPIGFCVAASIFFVLTGFLTHEEFILYGWRFAFFAVFAVNVVSLFARLRLLQTDFGSDERLMRSAPYGELIAKQWRPILLSTFLPLASYALFHMVTVFPLAYAKLYSDYAISGILLWELLGGSLAIVAVMASGPLADRFGRRTLLGATTALIPLLCLTIGTLDSNPAIFIVTGMVLLGLAYGQASAIVPNRYPTEYRYSGSALSTNFSWLFGAAFAPLTGLALTSTFGLWSAALYLLSGAVVTCAALYLLRISEHR